MSPTTIGVIGIGVLLLLMVLSMPIGLAMALAGFLGLSLLVGTNAALNLLAMIPFSTSVSYVLCVFPLFMLMGMFARYGEISKELYDTAHKWVGRIPGSLAISSLLACGGFAAICGDSLATAAAMGTVALPEMRRYNYDSALAAGVIAAGGTLGILIPPSLGFIIYGIITRQSIGKLFIAGIVPGLLLVTMFSLVVYFIARFNPQRAPAAAKFSLRERVLALKDVWGALVLFLFVMGGIYFGVFSPTEAGALAALGAFLLALVRGRLDWSKFKASLTDTAKSTVTILTIVIGAMIFSSFLAVTKLPFALTDFLLGLEVSPYLIIVLILFIFVILGCLMETLAMILLVIPIVFPIILVLGFDPIWFGVITVLVIEQALITPPIGLNVFVITDIAGDVPMYTIFRGIIPFWIAMMICIAILIVFPQIALFLPNLMS